MPVMDELISISKFLNIFLGVINQNNLQSELDVLNAEAKLNCNADQTNSFYGNRGALFCLLNKGDVAILGLRDLNGLKFGNVCSYFFLMI